MKKKQSLRRKFVIQVLMSLISVVVLSGIIQLFFINQQIAINVESQANLVSNNILSGIKKTEMASESIEDQIDLKMLGYAKYIASQLNTKTAKDISNEQLIELKEELGLEGITIFVQTQDDVIGVKSTDPTEVGFSFKPFGEEVLTPMMDVMEGKIIPRAGDGSYVNINELVLPISQSGSHENPVFIKYAYYHPEGTDFLINPYVLEEEVYKFTQEVGPDVEIKDVLKSNSTVKEIAVLNPRVFKDPSLEEELYAPLRKVEYGTFKYKSKRDVEILKDMVTHPEKITLIDTTNGEKLYQVFIPVNENRVIYIAFDYEEMSGPLYRHSIILIISGLLSLLVLFLLTTRFFSGIYEKIQQIIQQINSLEEGDLTAKSNVKDNSELESLSHSANRMVDRLNKLVRDTQENATKTQKLSVMLEAEASQSVEKMYEISTEATIKSREQLFDITLFLEEVSKVLAPYQADENAREILGKVDIMKEVANERTSATTDMTITLSDLLKSLHGQSSELSEISNTLLEQMEKFKL